MEQNTLSPCLFYWRNVNFGLNLFYIKYKIRVAGHLLGDFDISWVFQGKGTQNEVADSMLAFVRPADMVQLRASTEEPQVVLFLFRHIARNGN
jgi:hypothetical protein